MRASFSVADTVSMEAIVYTRFTVVVLAALCTATAATAQNPDPLPGRLVGQYTLVAGRNNKINVVPLELADIKVEGEKVTGIVANYRSPAGNCISDKTPFNGTYQNGQLIIKSMPMVSQFADGRPCGGIAINVKVSAGRANGTFKVGAQEGPIAFEAK